MQGMKQGAIKFDWFSAYNQIAKFAKSCSATDIWTTRICGSYKLQAWHGGRWIMRTP